LYGSYFSAEKSRTLTLSPLSSKILPRYNIPNGGACPNKILFLLIKDFSGGNTNKNFI